MNICTWFNVSHLDTPADQHETCRAMLSMFLEILFPRTELITVTLSFTLYITRRSKWGAINFYCDLLERWSTENWFKHKKAKNMSDIWVLHLNPSNPLTFTDLRKGQDQKRSSSTGFNDDCQELWIDGAEGAVPCHLGHTNVIITLLSLYRLAEDVTKLALPHDAATHGWGKERADRKEMKKN